MTLCGIAQKSKTAADCSRGSLFLSICMPVPSLIWRLSRMIMHFSDLRPRGDRDFPIMNSGSI